ncbi:hypothetical protein ACFSL6_18430 [Paenibacillus thailandensis]|uniref:YfhD family protein n=1 Tax=Paenibacillus thailandensis TaxID=393250 RepID=A0ABW5QSI5_9BACL
MANKRKQDAKAAVQSTRLNTMPVPGADDTEFSAEEAAQAFRDNNNAESKRRT